MSYTRSYSGVAIIQL